MRIKNIEFKNIGPFKKGRLDFIPGNLDVDDNLNLNVLSLPLLTNKRKAILKMTPHGFVLE